MSEISIENVSDTALWVAAYRAKESERPDAVYHDPLAAKLAGERGREFARSIPYGAITGWIMVVRTVAIDRMILQKISQGVDTIINIGAGLDTRPYRLNLPLTLRWIEIDFPGLIEYKNEMLKDEKPQCEINRFGIDLSNRAAAKAKYLEIAEETKNALVITEGVIAYLTNEQAGNLADDLRSIPSFKYWIQDFRKGDKNWRHPEKLKKKLANAPFRFYHPDPLSFFASHGWTQEQVIYAAEEGDRIGRPFPMPFPWNFLFKISSKKKREHFRKASGYALLQASDTVGKSL